MKLWPASTNASSMRWASSCGVLPPISIVPRHSRLTCSEPSSTRSGCSSGLPFGGGSGGATLDQRQGMDDLDGLARSRRRSGQNRSSMASAPISASGCRTVVSPRISANSTSSKPIDRERAGDVEPSGCGSLEDADRLDVGGGEDRGGRLGERQQLRRPASRALSRPCTPRRMRRSSSASPAAIERVAVAVEPELARGEAERVLARRRRRSRCGCGRGRADARSRADRRRRRRSSRGSAPDVRRRRAPWEARRAAARRPRSSASGTEMTRSPSTRSRRASLSSASSRCFGVSTSKIIRS